MLARPLITLLLCAALQGPTFSQCVFNESLVVGAAQNDKLGSAVAIKGEWAVVGAQQMQTGKQGKKGYVLSNDNGDWSLQNELCIGSGADNDSSFGTSVAIETYALAGSPGQAIFYPVSDLLHGIAPDR